MNCPFCKKSLIKEPGGYFCKKNKTHEFSIGNDPSSVNDEPYWLLYIHEDKIQIGKYPKGNYITFRNRDGFGGEIINIDPFSIKDSHSIINKYKKLKAFL